MAAEFEKIIETKVSREEALRLRDGVYLNPNYIAAYKSEKEAEEVLKEINDHPRARGKLLRSEKCPVCNNLVFVGKNGPKCLTCGNEL